MAPAAVTGSMSSLSFGFLIGVAMKRRGLWLTVTALFVFGLLCFAIAVLVGLKMPDGGSLRLERVTTTLLAMGGTLTGAAIAVAAVLLTLDLQMASERERRWAEVQVATVTEAAAWLDRVTRQFGDVVGAMQEWDHALPEQKDDALVKANHLARDFYDAEDLHVVERLEGLVEDEDVRTALGSADAVLRSWNETVAGDHTTPTVEVSAAAGEEWPTWLALSDARLDVLNLHAQAIRRAHGRDSREALARTARQ